MNTSPLRIAFLVPGNRVTRFLAGILRPLGELPITTTVCSLPLPLREPGRLFSLYRRLDRLLAPVAVDPLAPAALPGSLPVRELPGPPEWVQELGRMAREDGLDLLVVPGGLELPSSLPSAFRHGALVLDGLDFASQAPARAFAALDGAASCLTSRLIWHAPGRPPRLLSQPAAAVFPLSLCRTAAPACVTAARSIPRMVRELLDGGPEAWEARTTPLADASPAAVPGDAAVLRFLPRLARRAAAAAWRDVFFRPQWFLALRRDGGDPFDLDGFTPVFPPDASGWADPFPFVHEGTTHLFFEDIDKDTGLGSIAVMTQTTQGEFGPPQTVMRAPHHLSYPFVFAFGGEVYMVPESSQAARVELFRAVRFPLEWESAGTLLSGVRAVDATLFEHEGRWWLMANIRQEGGSSWDELSVFHAASPLGPFTPHPGNPVVSDVRRARPAGRVFRHGGRLYRPAQDCSGHYGRALAILEIETLTPQAYREVEAARHEAHVLGQGDSLHTYNSVPGLEAVDGRRYIPRLSFPRRA